MANFKRVDLYQKGTIAGVTAIRPVEGGPLGQRRMRLNADHVTVIYALGVASNDSNVFEVNLNGAKSFITDWSGISDIGNFVRVNKYTLTKQPEGSSFEGKYKWQYFGYGVASSARVVPNSVVSVVSVKANGVDQNGDDIGQECFRVTMIDGRSFVTDHDGWDTIRNYEFSL
jgi:hypothetical protein